MPNTLGVHASSRPGWFTIHDEIDTVVDVHVRRLTDPERGIVPAGRHWRENSVDLYVSADMQRIYAIDNRTFTVLHYQLLDVRQGGGGSMGAMRSDVVGEYRWFGDERYVNAVGL